MELQNQTFRVENFIYENEIFMETMFKHLEETNFLGVSVSCVTQFMYKGSLAVRVAALTSAAGTARKIHIKVCKPRLPCTVSLLYVEQWAM